MGSKVRDIKRVEVTTSAGSSVLAYTLTTTNNTSIRLKTELLGRRNFNTDTYSRISNHCFKNVSGTVSQVEASSDVFFVADTNVNLATLTFTISGNDIQIYVNADPDVTILSMSWELIIYIDIN